ncbi:unnamed protein product [Diplocarpon coronariae]
MECYQTPTHHLAINVTIPSWNIFAAIPREIFYTKSPLGTPGLPYTLHSDSKRYSDQHLLAPSQGQNMTTKRTSTSPTLAGC